MDTSAAVIGVAGLITTLAGTFGAPALQSRRAAKQARTAALDAAMLSLFVEVAASLQSTVRYLDWLTEEYRTSQYRHLDDVPSGASLEGRIMLLASQDVVAAWSALQAERERFYWWEREENGSQDELGPRATADEVQALRDAVERMRKAMRVAAGRD